MTYAIAAISLGFLSGFHCIGMCGPIALALPIGQRSHFMKVISILTYNLGRVITYSILGIVFGLLGESLIFFGFQQKLSIGLGVVILLVTLFPYFKKKLPSLSFPFISKLKSRIISQFEKSDLRSLFIIGSLNGLLPCGMVYIAIAGAVTSGTIINSISFMALFGLATIPFMFAVTYIGQLISLSTRNLIRKAQPFIIAVTAVLLILRGLNLGIDHISPKLNEERSVDEVCHKTIKCCHK